MSQEAALRLLLIVAAALQVLAAVVAVRLAPLGGVRRWWFFISAALVVQAARRVFMLVLEPRPQSGDVFATLLISILLLVGILGIRETFSRERQTRRKLAEEQAREESYSHYADVAIVVLDENALITHMNPTACTLTACEERDALGKNWFVTFVPEPTRSEVQPRFMQLMASPIEDDAYVQYSFLDTGGHEHSMVWHRRVLRDKAGRSVGTRSAGVDLTEQKRLEGELELHSLLLGSTTDSVVAYRPDGTIVYANEAASRLRGRDHTTIIGANMRDLIPPAEREAFGECLDSAILGATVAYETRTTDADRAPRTLEARARLVTVGNRELIVDAARDVTKRRLAERALRDSDERSRSLLRLYEPLGRANSHEAILAALETEIPEVMGYSGAGLLILDEDMNHARLLKSEGAMTKAADGIMALDERFRANVDGEPSLVLPIGNDPFLREIVRAEHIVVVEDARTDPRTDKAIVAAADDRTIINVPLMLAGRKLGVLNIGTFGDEGVRPPSREQLDYLSALANHVAVAMDRVQFLDAREEAAGALERAAEEAEAALDGIVRALASTTGERDLYTAMHQERVARLACSIAAEMGLPTATIDGIRIAGVLHDIGKIAVPTGILAKPGKLSEMELGIVRAHSEVGQRLLENVPFHTPVAKIVRQHHERLDGSGYPDGLRGDEILLEAKILAVADIVEAMASHRPYRPALGIDAAIEEIERGAGTEYDGHVVDACIRVVAAEALDSPQTSSEGVGVD